MMHKKLYVKGKKQDKNKLLAGTTNVAGWILYNCIHQTNVKLTLIRGLFIIRKTHLIIYIKSLNQVYKCKMLTVRQHSYQSNYKLACPWQNHNLFQTVTSGLQQVHIHICLR